MKKNLHKRSAEAFFFRTGSAGRRIFAYEQVFLIRHSVYLFFIYVVFLLDIKQKNLYSHYHVSNNAMGY